MIFWYYADEGQQRGPVSDTELDELVTEGRVKDDTLVWREGLEDWKPYAEAKPAPLKLTERASSPATPFEENTEGIPRTRPPNAPAAQSTLGAILCSECKKPFPKSEVYRYGSVWVCHPCRPVFLKKLEKGVRTAGEMEPAGFRDRFMAKLLDALIMATVSALIIGLFFIVFQAKLQTQQQGASFLIAFLAMIGLIGFWIFFYQVWFLGKFAATPGKMALGLRVVVADGSSVSYLRALGRVAVEMWISSILYIGYIIALFDDEKRTLHDIICHTRVIKK